MTSEFERRKSFAWHLRSKDISTPSHKTKTLHTVKSHATQAEGSKKGRKVKARKKNNLAKGQSSSRGGGGGAAGAAGPAEAGHACKTRQKCTSCAYLSNVQAAQRRQRQRGVGRRREGGRQIKASPELTIISLDPMASLKYAKQS